MIFVCLLFSVTLVAVKGFKLPTRVRHRSFLTEVHGVVSGRYDEGRKDDDKKGNK